jgi:sulfite reductase (ferredoxin)
VSGAETVKAESRALRGGIADALREPTDHFEEREKLLLKFHGVYQQDDRDARRERSRELEQGGGKRYSFMARVAIRAACSPPRSTWSSTASPGSSPTARCA